MRLTRTLFISDLHLDEARPRVIEHFERFLGEVVPGSDALYILGDLFEYWVGDDGLELPLPSRIARALGDTARQMPVAFMHGNRDFLIAERFARHAGVRLIEDPTIVDLNGERALLMHGDTLCTGDQAYQAFRRQVRDPAWQAAALARPLDERVALARGLRAESEQAKNGKAMDIMDVATEAVDEAFRRSGCRLLIHGHTHRPGVHQHVVDGRQCTRWVLSDWYRQGSYLEATPAGLRSIAIF